MAKVLRTDVKEIESDSYESANDMVRFNRVVAGAHLLIDACPHASLSGCVRSIEKLDECLSFYNGLTNERLKHGRINTHKKRNKGSGCTNECIGNSNRSV